MTRKTSTSYEKSRLKELLWHLLVKYHPDCYFCHLPFKKEDVLPSRGVDNLTEHHRDGNHENNKSDNWSYAHRTCHKAYHSKDNINSKERDFWRNFK